MRRVFFLFIFFCFSARADEPLRVGYGPIAPFVITTEIEAGPIGFDIDLWSSIAKELQQPYRLIPVASVTEGLSKVESGELDIALGAISITLDREQRVDFTYPVYDTGLGVMIKLSKVSYWDAYRLDIILGFLLLIISAGHLIWFCEKGSLFDKRYFRGVFEGIYWAIVTASTVGYGDKVAKGRGGQLVAILVIFLSLPLFGMFIGNITSAITLQEQRAAINSPSDLGGKVGVIKGTTSADFVGRYRLNLVQVSSSKELFQYFEEGYVDSIVYDIPALKYYAQRSKDAVVLPQTFDPQHLAFAVANGSPLRERVNHVFLRLHEAKYLDKLKVRWFGTL
jgi:polar amino acid transport system substrate-binding protein